VKPQFGSSRLRDKMERGRACPPRTRDKHANQRPQPAFSPPDSPEKDYNVATGNAPSEGRCPESQTGILTQFYRNSSIRLKLSNSLMFSKQTTSLRPVLRHRWLNDIIKWSSVWQFGQWDLPPSDKNFQSSSQTDKRLVGQSISCLHARLVGWLVCWAVSQSVS